MKNFEKALIASLHGDAEQATQLFRSFVAEQMSPVSEDIGDVETFDSDTLSSILHPLLGAGYVDYMDIKAKLKSPWQYREGSKVVDLFNHLMQYHKCPYKLITVYPDSMGEWKWEVQHVGAPAGEDDDGNPVIPMHEDGSDSVMTSDEFGGYAESCVPNELLGQFETLMKFCANRPLNSSVSKMNEFLSKNNIPFSLKKVDEKSMGGLVWHVAKHEPVTEGGGLQRANLAVKINNLRVQANEISKKIDQIVKDGGTVGISDPLSVKLKGIRDKIAKLTKEKNLTEGELEITQGEDGVLHLVHHPEGTGSVVSAPDTADVPEIELDPAFEALDADEEDLDELQESLADDLEKMILANDDGQTVGDGEKIDQESHSPIPNVAPEDRPDGAKAAETVKDEHNGFDVEPAPKVDGSTDHVNTHDKAKDALEKPKSGGALLTQMGDDAKAKSPISGKKLRESREQQQALLAFCDAVEKVVEQQYGLDDGGDLCFTLVENGTINMKNGVDMAARIVAQHLSQQ